jgi:secreted trypsin-like serine protease
MAALTRKAGIASYSDPGAFLCAGALIHANYILTTATCVSRLFGQDLSLFRVAVGARRLEHPAVSADQRRSDDEHTQFRDIQSLIIHEEFQQENFGNSRPHHSRARVNDIGEIQ